MPPLRSTSETHDGRGLAYAHGAAAQGGWIGDPSSSTEQMAQVWCLLFVFNI
jgi:hypothetical protein